MAFLIAQPSYGSFDMVPFKAIPRFIQEIRGEFVFLSYSSKAESYNPRVISLFNLFADWLVSAGDRLFANPNINRT